MNNFKKLASAFNLLAKMNGKGRGGYRGLGSSRGRGWRWGAATSHVGQHKAGSDAKHDDKRTLLKVNTSVLTIVNGILPANCKGEMIGKENDKMGDNAEGELITKVAEHIGGVKKKRSHRSVKHPKKIVNYYYSQIHLIITHQLNVSRNSDCTFVAAPT